MNAFDHRPAAAGSPPGKGLVSGVSTLVLGFVLGICLIAIVAAAAFFGIDRLREDAGWVARTEEIIAALEEAQSMATDAESAGRGYALTGDAAFLQPYTAVVPMVPSVIDRISRLIGDNPDQLTRSKRLSALIAQRIERVHDLIDLRRREGPDAAREHGAALEAGRILHDAIRRLIGDMQATEKRLLKQRQAASATSALWALTSIASISLLAIGLAGLALYSIARDLAGSRRARTALQVANALLDSSSRYARSLIEASLDPLVTIGPDGRIMDVNAATEQATGVAREALIGSDFCDYFTAPDQARAGYQQVFAKGWVRDYPLALRHASGQLTEVLYNASVFRDAQGDVAGVFAAARDITERKRAEAERARYQEQLEQEVGARTADLTATNADLEAFSYSVSHDLRAPLRAIDGFVGILREEYAPHLDAEGLRVLTVVSDNARKMGQLIDDILALSRASRWELQRQWLDMNTLVAEVWRDLAAQRGARAIDFRCGELPPAWGDARALRQVWQNLLDNAVKFSHDRTPAVIDVSGEATPEDTRYRVSDNGVGFNPDYAHKLFVLFQRLHGMDEFAGTGVGLAIVKRFVQKHGGRVAAEGVPGAGATFRFSLANRSDGERPAPT